MKFTMTPHGNELLDGDGFYLSYRAAPAPEAALYDDVLGPLVGITDRSPGGAETALYTKNDGCWRILNGDFRAEYEAAFPGGLLACLAVYDRHRSECRNDWSTDAEVDA